MNFSKEIECPNCNWSWDVEPEDDKPCLCHKCGYDSNLKDFDIISLNKWKQENQFPFEERLEEGMHIRTFKEDVDNNTIITKIVNACVEGIKIYEEIRGSFIDKKISLKGKNNIIQFGITISTSNQIRESFMY